MSPAPPKYPQLINKLSLMRGKLFSLNKHAFLVIGNNGSKIRKVNMSPKDQTQTLMITLAIIYVL